MDTTEKKPPKSAAPPATRVGLALVFSAGEVVTPPRRFRPGREALVIGRDAAGGVPLPADPRASRRHASVFEGPSCALRLVDEGSTNGTWVNGIRVVEADLAEGDVITVGDSLFVVGAEPEGPDVEVPGLVGTSEASRRLRSRLARAAPGGAPLLLFGDAGCGVETAAQALHALSGRRGAFVAIHCGAAPGGLTEGQLFGQTAGAFGPDETRPGLFGAAEGGTLFLEDVGELKPALQPKLLLALRERVICPIGAASPRPCDVRVVAATERALGGAAAGGRVFFGDLYEHLVERTLHMPPLRDRREDVLALIAHALGTPSPKLEVELAERLLLYDWPYNVRELRSLAKQLRIRSGDGPYELDPVEAQLTPRPKRVSRERPAADLPTLPERPALKAPTPRDGLAALAPTPRDGSAAGARAPSAPTPRDGFAADERPPPASRRDGAEREAGREQAAGAKGRDPPPGRAQLEALLRRHGGVVSEVARAVSRSRAQVYRWLEHHGLDAETFRR
jgi:DNA-binding NtrC family response regulator